MNKCLISLLFFTSRFAFGQCTLNYSNPPTNESCETAFFVSEGYFVNCIGPEGGGNGGYVLSFDDEFNGTTLNLALWQSILYGHDHALNHRNDQLQYWTPNNLVVSDGILNVITKTEFVSQKLMIDDWDSSRLMDDSFPNLRDFNYTSGSFRSLQKFPAGLWEMRCKIAANPCIDWAFWPRFDGTDNRYCEIDAPEVYSNNSPSDPYIANFNLISSQCGEQNIANYGWCSPNDWHIISVQWDRYYVVCKMDGAVVAEEYSLVDAIGHHILECDNGGIAAGDYIRNREMPIFTNMNLLVDFAVRFANLGSYGDDPATSEIDWIRGYTYLDCNKNVTICNWNPDRSGPIVTTASLEDPTVYTGNTITVAGDPDTCVAIVQPGQFLNLYAATQISLENGFSAQNGSSFSASIVPCNQLLPANSTIVGPKDVMNGIAFASDNSFLISPNPTNAEASVKFKIAQGGQVKIKLFNEIGDYLGTIFDQTMSAGSYSQLLTTTAYSAGMYFLKIEAQNFSKAQKLIITN